MQKTAKITTVFGRRGSGKSFRVKKLIKSSGRVLVFDPIGEYPAEGFTPVNSVLGLLTEIKKNYRGFRIAWTANRLEANHTEELRALINILFKCQKPYFENKKGAHEMTLVIEEAALTMPNQINNPKLDIFKNACNIGRHYGINMIIASQSPAEVLISVRKQAEETYFFGLSNIRDIEAAADVIGKVNAEKLLRIPVNRGYHFTNNQITLVNNLD